MLCNTPGVLLMMEGKMENPGRKTFYYLAVDLRLASQQVTGVTFDDAKPGDTSL